MTPPMIRALPLLAATLALSTLPAGPGAACGRIALTAEHAVAMAAKGEPVVLVREETSPTL